MPVVPGLLAAGYAVRMKALFLGNHAALIEHHSCKVAQLVSTLTYRKTTFVG